MPLRHSLAYLGPLSLYKNISFKICWILTFVEAFFELVQHKTNVLSYFGTRLKLAFYLPRWDQYYKLMRL